MFWTIVGAILAAAFILFVLFGLLAMWVEHRELQDEIDLRQARHKRAPQQRKPRDPASKG